jgi:hypothetical protein
VGQSTTLHSDDRAVLFQHGSELSEFSDLLSELAMPVDECSAGFPTPKLLEGARIVIASGKRLLESGTPNLSLWPRTIAVIDDSSRTLVHHLNRIGVAMVIRRPIHPRALRLLLLHEIYHGPERRVRKRVLIGHPIRISSGLFRPHATLLELSPTGARIELANAPKVGTRIRILIGKELTKNKPVKLQAKVIRSIRASSKSDLAESEIAVAILGAKRHAKTIKAILDRFALSPAKWKTKQPRAEPESHRAALAPKVAVTESGISRSLPPTHLPSIRSEVEPEIGDTPNDDTTAHEGMVSSSRIGTVTIDPAIPDEIDSPAGDTTSATAGGDFADDPQKNSNDSAERRCDVRIPYDERVVALGEEAARVLVGRDLCAGGMRIAATASVAVGDVLRVALHSGTQSEPLVVLASALRDDGDDGLVLTFDVLSETQQEQLDKIITGGLPVHANNDALGDASAMGEGIVVAEVLETVSPESDAEIEAHLDSVFDTSEVMENAR